MTGAIFTKFGRAPTTWTTLPSAIAEVRNHSDAASGKAWWKACTFRAKAAKVLQGGVRRPRGTLHPRRSCAHGVRSSGGLPRARSVRRARLAVAGRAGGRTSPPPGAHPAPCAFAGRPAPALSPSAPADRQGARDLRVGRDARAPSDRRCAATRSRPSRARAARRRSHGGSSRLGLPMGHADAVELLSRWHAERGRDDVRRLRAARGRRPSTRPVPVRRHSGCSTSCGSSPKATSATTQAGRSTSTTRACSERGSSTSPAWAPVSASSARSSGRSRPSARTARGRTARARTSAGPTPSTPATCSSASTGCAMSNRASRTRSLEAPPTTNASSTPRGRALLWAAKRYPEDGHSAGTGLTTLSILHRHGLVGRELVERVARRVLDGVLRHGRAVHRRYRVGRTTVRYVRWCDAHVALGLVDVAATLSGAEDMAPRNDARALGLG